jgi:hypothetical protein
MSDDFDGYDGNSFLQKKSKFRLKKKTSKKVNLDPTAEPTKEDLKKAADILKST